MKRSQIYSPCAKASRTRFLLFCTTAFLTACGGSSGDSSTQQSAASGPIFEIPADTISRLGTVSFTTASGEAADLAGASSGIIDAYAEFEDFGQVMSQAYLDERYSASIGAGCEITIDSSDDTQDVGVENSPLVEEFESNSRYVSAGDVLTISTPAGTWADMQLSDDFGFYYDFQTDVSSLGDLPQGSTISIPGADFPAFEAASIPHVDRITEGVASNLADRFLTTDTQLTWSVPAQLNPKSFAFLTIYTDDFDAESNTSSSVEVECVMVDDGSYSFPDNVKQLISDYQIEIDNVYFARAAITTEIRGDAAVQIINVSRFLF